MELPDGRADPEGQAGGIFTSIPKQPHHLGPPQISSLLFTWVKATVSVSTSTETGYCSKIHF